MKLDQILSLTDLLLDGCSGKKGLRGKTVFQKWGENLSG